MELHVVTKPEEIMDIKEIIKPENLVYEKSKVLNDDVMHYCPGCVITSYSIHYTKLYEKTPLQGVFYKIIR